MQIPDAEDLRRFVHTLLATDGTPVEIRNECHRLLLAVRADDLELVTESLARIKQLADQAGLALPQFNHV